MTMTRISLVLLVALAACARTDDAATDSAGATTAAATMDDRATRAAGISDAIAANPAAADSILTANGMTREQFERTLYDIAADSAQSAAYKAARRTT